MGSFPPALQSLAAAFRWRTMDGRVMTLDEMQTSHIFNSMKMIFNHIAEAYGAEPVWFQHRYDGYHTLARSQPRELARTVAVFCYEIERRGDLPDKYVEPYRLMLNQILGVRAILDDAIGRLPPAAEGEQREEEWYG